MILLPIIEFQTADPSVERSGHQERTQGMEGQGRHHTEGGPGNIYTHLIRSGFYGDFGHINALNSISQ